MRPSAFVLLVPFLLLGGLGCPIDIDVRPPSQDGGDCAGPCTLPCDRDSQCPEDQRCDITYNKRCEPGLRLTEACTVFTSCPSLSICDEGYCAQSCIYGCPTGYQCGPEEVCVEACTGGPPGTLGNYCESSMECTRCGFCVSTGGEKKCHQPCKADAECLEGGLGACQALPGSTLRVCRLP
ncbi:hypothetical protein [Stigmatella aurantiaca]|uniref:Latent transforming growth factor beta binding protein 4 n=1 Tax=Stigmatella aurantiaca (strain DW4/3-1) TaxID=378806 RepID=Q08YL1_STIAD|nr:hypothetical protein [Stigmatella aurantiaca]ADO73779.1 uncharacterized protein STAUR_6019 [Stigmatella aurantiaca DW4/3-1]EAU65569.1 latent transforming growth factor beta binding protein 4 [Stigmatella aurantiaca DW4/3-1]